MRLTDNEYFRYQVHLSDLRVEFLQQQMTDTSAARFRSLLLCGGRRTLVTRSSSLWGKRKRAKPEPPPWIEHVRDGQALTPHGSELLRDHEIRSH